MSANRIAIAYDCLFPFTTGGGERQYVAFARAMAQRGREVTYFTATQWDDDDELPEDFHVEAVTGALQLYDAGGARSSSAAARYAWGLFRALRRERTRIDAAVVSGLPVLNVFAARAALFASGTPLLVDYLEVWGRRQWVEYAGTVMGSVAWLLQRAAIALSPAASCHSQLSAARLRSEGFRGRILLSPGLISGDAHAAVSTDPAPSTTAHRPPYVLYAGRHIEDKRVETIPAAVAVARAEIPDLDLVILGDGPTTARVRAAVEEAGGEGTRMPGFVAQDELDRLMAGAACLVNPSRREGYGLVVVEAAAHGTPTVLVEDPGNAATELIDDDVNGFVAPSAEPAHLAAAIVAAVRGGEDLRARTTLWYDEALRTRTIDRTVDNMLAAIDAADERSRRRRAGVREGRP